MDVVVIDVLDAWGMLLSRKWVANLGGSIQMDLSYATILTCEGTFVTLYREHPRMYHVEDPIEPMNELICANDEFGNYSIMANNIDPSIEDVAQKKNESMWKMHFDSSHTRMGSRVGIVFTYP